MSTKLVVRVLRFLNANGESKRSVVTNEMRNYSGEDQAVAIRFLTSKKMIEFIAGEKLGAGGRKGPTPVFIKITDAGREYLEKNQSIGQVKSIWFPES